MHRIAHEWEISYSLLEEGYLAIGWSKFSTSGFLKQVSGNDVQSFNNFMAKNNESGRSRWNLWRFSQFKKGDIVVVPMFDKEFTVVEVEEPICNVGRLVGRRLTTQKEEEAEVMEGGIQNKSTGYCYDIGFLIKVQPLTQRRIKRSYADARLISRMKLRQTNADITDIAGSVDAALCAESPISFHDKLTDAVTANIYSVIQNYITPQNLEHVVCWYMKKKGASNVYIPAKNEHGKENGADADVIAEFEALRIIFYIQVKKHEDKTGSWAIHQISEYASQKQDSSDDYTYIPWAVTTAEFDEAAIQEGKSKGIRLIGGSDFIRMLIDCGIDDIDSALKSN